MSPAAPSPGTLAAEDVACVVAVIAAVVVLVLAVQGVQLARDWFRRRKAVPGLPRDGKALSQPEQERLDEVEDGYGRPPMAMRRLR